MGNALAKDAYGRPPDLLEEYCYLTFRSDKKMQNIYPWIFWRHKKNIYPEELWQENAEYIPMAFEELWKICKSEINKYVFSKNFIQNDLFPISR